MTLLEVFRITVFVPPSHLESLKSSLLAVEPMEIGNYANVMWTTVASREQFCPKEGSRPAAGRVGETVELDTVRLECCIPRDATRLERVIELGIRPSHPWETPVIIVEEVVLVL